MLTVFKTSKYSEVDAYSSVLNEERCISDVKDNGANPFEELARKEDTDNGETDFLDLNPVDVISALLAYLLKDLKPLGVCARVFLLAYTLRPQLIGGKSLNDIGMIIGCSKQNLSKILERQDKFINFRCRNRHSEETKESYRKHWFKKNGTSTFDMKQYQREYYLKNKGSKNKH